MLLCSELISILGSSKPLKKVAFPGSKRERVCSGVGDAAGQSNRSQFYTFVPVKLVQTNWCGSYVRPGKRVLNPSLICFVAFFSPTVCHVERGHVLREYPPHLSTMAWFPPPLPSRGGLCGLSGAVATFPTSLAPIGEAQPSSLGALPPPGLLVFL